MKKDQHTHSSSVPLFDTSICKSSNHRRSITLTVLATCISLILVGCGDDDKSSFDNLTENPVKLIESPEITKVFTAEELKQAIDAEGLSAKIDNPICGITVRYVNHTTTGVAGEATNATGAVIMPNGSDVNCQGKRPITLYAHGTNSDKNYNLAALNDPSNPAYLKSLAVAATYAGQGDILIAPNYPGYGKSDLSYIPYNTMEQGKQMIDALKAGKLAVNSVNADNKTSVSSAVTYNDKLFITGFSQGGYATMATAKLLDEAGTPATAISPSSGAYAIAAFADSILSGNVIAGGTIFLPLLGASYREEFKNANGVGSPFDDIYAARYTNAPNLFPTQGPVNGLFQTGQLPVNALFQAAPTGYDFLDPISPPSPLLAFGFDKTNYLFNTDFRAKYVQDMKKYPDGTFPTFTATADLATNSQNSVRQAFIKNDLRNYKPTMPVLMCGGNQDPSVAFDINATTQSRIWKDKKDIQFALLDVDITNKDKRMADNKSPYVSTLPTLINNGVQSAANEVQQGFAIELQTLLTNAYRIAYTNAITANKTQAEADTAGRIASYTALLSNYHGLADTYCVRAANAFFAQYR